MSKLALIVTVRSGSKRLPKKCLKKIYNDVCLLEVVIRRAKKVGHEVILATTLDKVDDKLEQLGLKEKVQVYRGSPNNKIHRWKKCFEEYKISHAMLVDGDDPTFSYSTAKRAIEQLVKSGRDLVKAHKSLMPGFITYGISKKGLDKLYLLAKDYYLDTDVIDVYIKNAKLTKTLIKPLTNELVTDQVRLTVDYEEDLNFYRRVHQKIHYLEESYLIVETIIRNKLNNINFFRHDEFLKNQNNFNVEIERNFKKDFKNG